MTTEAGVSTSAALTGWSINRGGYDPSDLPMEVVSEQPKEEIERKKKQPSTSAEKL